MPLKREPRILIDPVSAFFAGFVSVFARMFLGLIAIVCGLVVGAFSGSEWGPFAIFDWAERGVWFLLGLSSLISIFFALWLFVRGSDGRRTFFFIFSAAALHFSSGLFPPDSAAQVLWGLGAYGIAAVCYWYVPRAISALMPRHSGEEEIGTVPPDEERAPGESQSGPAWQDETANEDPFITGAEPLDHPADESPEERA